MNPDLRLPLAVVCHDAGATNLILPWLDTHLARLRACMQGPAAVLWRQRFGEQGLVDTPSQALDGAAMLLSGTGWASNLEHEARRQALARAIPSIGVIDHWVNYAARFQRDGQQVLPEQIWVTDPDAFALARTVFPGHQLRLQPNLYLRAQVERIAPAPDPRHNRNVLYVLEPTRDDWGRGSPGEFQALDHFVARAGTLGLHRRMRLRLRPHPSDPPRKYDAWLARQHDLDVGLDPAPTLAAAMDDCAWVAGCESMALVVALATGRRVVCTLPPWAPPCRLPQRDLIMLAQTADAHDRRR